MIEQLPGAAYLAPQPANGAPAMIVRERAYLPCGCWAAVGVRVDTKEPALGAAACSAMHHPLIEDFMLNFTASLGSPEERPAVEVANECLEMAARELGVPTE